MYGWPIRLLCAVAAICYLLAGVAKVTGKAGWSWALGTNLLDQIAYDTLYKELIDPHRASTTLQYVYHIPYVLMPAAVMSLVLELGAPIALLHRKIGYVWSGMVYGMHWGIKILMTLTFEYPISGAAFLCFFPVEKPVLWVDEKWKKWRVNRSQP
jgi:hypothetical protein